MTSMNKSVFLTLQLVDSASLLEGSHLLVYLRLNGFSAY